MFARLAEGERSGKEKLADLLHSILARLLRKIFPSKKNMITRSELLREIEVISKGIRNGSRPRKTFDSETGAGAIAVKGAQATEVNEELASYTASQVDQQFVSEPTATESGYETDLFGNPIPAPRGRAKAARSAGAGVRGDVQPPAPYRTHQPPLADTTSKQSSAVKSAAG